MALPVQGSPGSSRISGMTLLVRDLAAMTHFWSAVLRCEPDTGSEEPWSSFPSLPAWC